jgi:hypothetical protein
VFIVGINTNALRLFAHFFRRLPTGNYLKNNILQWQSSKKIERKMKFYPPKPGPEFNVLAFLVSCFERIEIFFFHRKNQLKKIKIHLSLNSMGCLKLDYYEDLQVRTCVPMLSHEPKMVLCWLSMDPLAEKYESISPYVYAGNVPTRFVDFDGQDFGIVIDFEHNTITFTQTFYTDGNKKTNRLAKETSDYMNSLSGKFGLKTKSDGTFKINFDTNVVEGKNEEDGREKASNDKQGGFFNIDESSVGKALGFDPKSGRAWVALTDEGGDYTNFTDNDIITGKTFRHENLHGLGARHQAIGGEDDRYNSINERVLGAAFEIANNRIPNFSIKTTNLKKGDAFTSSNSNAIDIPKVTVKADSPNYGNNSIKLKGTIIRLTQ